MTHYQSILSSYDSIHRSPLNRASHAIGIPLIMTSIIAALSYFHPSAGGVWHYANPATVLAVATVALVMSWSQAAGLAYLALVIGCTAVAQALITHLTGWSAVAIIAGGCALGWVFQFVGHGFEGKSPQFVMRPENLLLGPIMIMAELFPAIRPRGDA